MGYLGRKPALECLPLHALGRGRCRGSLSKGNSQLITRIEHTIAAVSATGLNVLLSVISGVDN